MSPTSTVKSSGAVAVLLAGALAVAGCGGSGASSTPTPAATKTPRGSDFMPGTAGVVFLSFEKSGLSATGPRVEGGKLRFAAGAAITLVVRSADGRPHGVTVEGAPRPLRVILLPGQTKRLAIGALPSGSYRLAPDGATEPVTLVVR